MPIIYILGLHWKPLLELTLLPLFLKRRRFLRMQNYIASFLRPNRYILATLFQIGVLAVVLAQHSDHSASISLG